MQEYEEVVSFSSQIKYLCAQPSFSSSEGSTTSAAATAAAAAAAADAHLTALHGCINSRHHLGLLPSALSLIPQLKEATLDVYGICDHPSFASCLNAEATLDRMQGSFDAAIAKFKLAIRLLKVVH